MSETSFASLEPTLLARKGGAKPAMRPQLAPLMASIDELEEANLNDLGWNDMGECEAAAGDEPALAETLAPYSLAMTQARDDTPTPLILSKKTPGQHPIIDPMTSADIVDITARASRRAANEDTRDADPIEGACEPVFLRPQTAASPDGSAAQKAIADQPLLLTKPGARKAPDTANTAEPTKRAASARAATLAPGRRAAFTLRLDAERHLKLRLAATMKSVSAQSLVITALDHLFADIENLDDLARRMKPE